MLFSIPKEELTSGGFNNPDIHFNNKQLIIDGDKKYELDMKDIAKIYLTTNNYITAPSSLNVNGLSKYFFNGKEFNFSSELIKYENIKNMILMLKDIDEDYLLNFSKEIPETSYLNIINFYLNLIYYLVEKIQSLNLEKSARLECSYSLLYKCCELTNMSLEYNNKLTELLESLYRNLTTDIGKLIR